MAAGGVAINLTACVEDSCRSGDPTPECSQEAGGVNFVATCEASDPTGQQSCIVTSEGRTIDVLCGEASSPSDCALGGDARKTTGITEDTTGILLDQGSGALTLNMDRFKSSSFGSGLDLEILAAAVGDDPVKLTATLGTCADCPAPATITVNHDYAWIQVAHLPQQAFAGSVVLSGAGIEIGDIRMTAATTRASKHASGCGRVPGFSPE
jgi:hypothetical protein